MLRHRTKWKSIIVPTIGMRCFSEEFGFFKIKKVWKCMVFCKNAVTPGGSHWFDKKKALIVTEEGLKYTVPYIWIIFNSTDETGKMLYKIENG